LWGLFNLLADLLIAGVLIEPLINSRRRFVVPKDFAFALNVPPSPKPGRDPPGLDHCGGFYLVSRRQPTDV
jgi:hypothetical protein